MKKRGRKGFSEELDIIRRYSDLSEHYFNVVTELLTSKDKKDRIEGAKLVRGAFEKMIPQDITSGGEKLPTPIYGGQSLTERTPKQG